MKRRAPLVLAALLLLELVIQCVAFVRANSQTYDEGATLASGALLLRGGPDVNAEHPPLARVLSALPNELVHPPRLDVERWLSRHESVFGLGRDYLYEGGVPHREVIALGRVPMVVATVLLVALIGLFALRLWGPRAGLLALALAAFDPNLIAYGSLASHDGLLALFVTLAAFAIAEFFARPRNGTLVVIGLATGLALVTKFSGLVVVGGVGLAFLLQAILVGGMPLTLLELAPPPRGLRSLAHAAGNVLIALLVALLVVRLAYGARGLDGYVVGVRAQLAHQAGGHPAFFLGEISTRGWAAYFPVAIALKSPPLLLVLAGVSVALFRRGRAFGNAWFVVLLPVVLLLVTLVLSRVDIGVRYALPLFPLLAVAASRVVTIPWPRGAVVALAVALCHHVVAAIRIAPHDLAFFSDLAGGPARGHRYLADSNLDWGQDLGTLAEWSRVHRPARLSLAYFGTASVEAHGIAYEPAPSSCPHLAPWRGAPAEPDGRGAFLAVSTMNAQGLFFSDHASYAWLSGRTPVALLGYSIAVYDISRDADAHRQLARLHERGGEPERAELARARAAAIERPLDGGNSPPP
jgi:hypothetical protein